MKLLILANNDVGLYKFRKECLAALIAEGHEVHISLPRGEFIKNLEEIGCKYEETNLERRGMNPLRDISLFFAYLKLIRKIKPDAILTYTVKPNVYGGLAARVMRKKYIANVTGLGTSVENPGPLQKLVLTLYKIGMSKAECVFFQNSSNLEFMKAHRLGGKNMRLLPGSGVDLNLHFPREFPGEEEPITFLAVMRVMEAKGIFEFLECAKNIKEKYPKTRFLLAGDYDEESLRAPVEAAQEKGYIEYLGFQSDVDALVEKSHAIIQPSHHEGMSNVLLEAAACARAVIASDIPGCRESFDEGVSGFGFEVKNAASQQASVEKFINLSYDEKKQMGIFARAKMEREFDRKIVISAYLEELEKIDVRKQSKEDK